MLALYAEHECKVIFSVEELDNPQHYGEVDAEKRVVINSRKGSLLKIVESLLHEGIHILEPTWRHARVYEAEQAVLEYMTMAERQHLLFLAVDNGYWRD